MLVLVDSQGDDVITKLARDSVEVLVETQWVRVTGTTPGTLDTSFFESGGSSIAAARLAGALTRASGCKVGLNVVFDHPTLRGISAWLRGALTDEGMSSRLYTLKADGEGFPLVLTPGGAGSLVGQNAFADARFARPVLGLLAPGGDGTEEPVRTLPELIETFRETLVDAGVGRRLHLGGFCGGGVFAYELARMLQEDGWDVLSLSLFDSSLSVPDVPRDVIIRERLEEIAERAGLAHLGRDGSPREVFAQLAAHGMDLLESDAMAFERRLDMYALGWRMLAEYEPGKAIDLPVRSFVPPLFDAGDDGSDGRSWASLGMVDFREVVVGRGGERVTENWDALDAVEEWLRRTDLDAREAEAG